MRKASFSYATSVSFDNVPIPDHLKSNKEIFDYLNENIDDFKKYMTDDIASLYNDPIYSVNIIYDDDNSITITIDD